MTDYAFGIDPDGVICFQDMMAHDLHPVRDVALRQYICSRCLLLVDGMGQIISNPRSQFPNGQPERLP